MPNFLKLLKANKNRFVISLCFFLSHSAFSQNSHPDWLVEINGILWQKCSLGQNWNSNSTACSGTVMQASLQDTVATVNRLNTDSKDWEFRLPWVHELAAIVDCGEKSTRAIAMLPGQSKETPHWCEHGSKSPTLNNTLFPGSLPSFYWTQSKSKTNSNGVDFYWGLNFEFGVLNDSIPVQSRIATRLVAASKLSKSKTDVPQPRTTETKPQLQPQSQSQATSTSKEFLDKPAINTQGKPKAIEKPASHLQKRCDNFSVGASIQVPVPGYPRKFNGLVTTIQKTTLSARILDASAPKHLMTTSFLITCASLK